jgi:leucyl/phenylalanyl-tRNA--protein transferase
MFSLEPDASKLATVALVERVKSWGFKLIDCQVINPHTESLGAENWPRPTFLHALAIEVPGPTRKGSWANAELPAT